MSADSKNKCSKSCVSINIDGQNIEVPSGMNIIDAARLVGKEIPHYCYHPKLSVAGNCRMCLIEMGMPMRDRQTGESVCNEDGSVKIGWGPKPAIACATNAAEGMHIRTNTEQIQDCQKGVMEFLLLNHPLDCPICDQAGECSLQEFATQYGQGYSRFIEAKNVKPKRTRLGPRVTLDDERCILCSRCVRFCKEIANDDVLGFIDHGSHSTLTCYPGKELKNNYSLNTVDICPVGALTSTDFRFKMRVWFLKQTPSICIESSVGTNTTIWSREGKIYRITPRQNEAVNDNWMTDSGRELYKLVDSERRLRHFELKQKSVSPDIALKSAVELLKQGSFAIVGSGHQSIEEQFLLADILKCNSQSSSHRKRVYFVSHIEEGDALLLSRDRTPNLRGAFLTGLIQDYPKADLSDLAKEIELGNVKTLFVCGEDLVERGISEELLSKLNIVYMGTHKNKTSELAVVVLPSLTVFEKSGSFVNQQWRVQKFEQAVPGPLGILSDIVLLAYVLSAINETPFVQPHIQSIWNAMECAIPQLKGIAFDCIPDSGLLLNHEDWQSISFPEGKTLHFDPEQSRILKA